VAAALLALAVALALHQTHALEALELKSIDARFALRGTRKPPAGIVIVGIDPQTFSQLQLQWPFPRSLHARAIDRLRQDGAKAIVYDVQFTEPTTPADRSWLAKQEAVRQDDMLIGAVHKAGNVVLASSEVGENGETSIFGGGAILARIGARAGAAISPPDSDGVDRRMLFSYRGLRTLGIVGAEVTTGRVLFAAALGGGDAWIDFAGPAGTFPEVSFVRVLRGEAPASEFAGKTVVVGATASNLQDVHATPFDGAGLMSGAELTANAIATAQEGFPLRATGGYVALLLILALGAAGPLAGVRLSPGWVLLVCLAAGAAYCLVAQLAFQAGTIVPLSDPIAALLLGCAAAVVADSFGERRRLQALRRALGPPRGRAAQFFISYRRRESQWPAKILNRALAERFGEASVFMDEMAIDAGDIWPREIEEASSGCAVMLVLVGPDWADVRRPDGTRRLDDRRDWVRREVETGLEHAQTVVVPVLHDGAAMPDRDDLPDSLKRLVDCNAISFTGGDIDTEIDRLVDSVQSGRIRSRLGEEPATGPARA
jgi:CHASE2 domain-containing sensor protein